MVHMYKDIEPNEYDNCKFPITRHLMMITIIGRECQGRNKRRVVL